MYIYIVYTRFKVNMDYVLKYSAYRMHNLYFFKYKTRNSSQREFDANIAKKNKYQMKDTADWLI